MPHARLLAIEANYDSGLLDEAAKVNPQVRFAVDVRGNFSNAQAASTVEAYAWPGLEDVVALYLSRQYNAPDRVTAAMEAALEQVGCKARVVCASPDETLSVLPEGVSAGDGNGTAPEKPAVESAAAEMPCVAGGVANMAAPEASVSEMPGCNASVETPALQIPVTVAAGACPVKDEPVSEQLAAGEALVEPIASGTPAGDGLTDKDPIAEMPTLETAPVAPEPYSAPEDILLPEQAREMGYTDLQGLLALWVQQGCLAESPAISADGLLRALIAADMLDPRDMTPTEKGIELGVWAAFETEGLAPIFATCMAGGLWEHVQAFL